MKRLYFISPSDRSLTIYYEMVPDDLDISAMDRHNTGYNDSYEMRSQYICKPLFSDNFEDLQKILEKRKALILKEAYEELINRMGLKVPTLEEAVLHDDIDCPF